MMYTGVYLDPRQHNPESINAALISNDVDVVFFAAVVAVERGREVCGARELAGFLSGLSVPTSLVLEYTDQISVFVQVTEFERIARSLGYGKEWLYPLVSLSVSSGVQLIALQTLVDALREEWGGVIVRVCSDDVEKYITFKNRILPRLGTVHGWLSASHIDVDGRTEMFELPNAKTDLLLGDGRCGLVSRFTSIYNIQQKVDKRDPEHVYISELEQRLQPGALAPLVAPLEPLERKPENVSPEELIHAVRAYSLSAGVTDEQVATLHAGLANSIHWGLLQLQRCKGTARSSGHFCPREWMREQKGCPINISMVGFPCESGCEFSSKTESPDE